MPTSDCRSNSRIVAAAHIDDGPRSGRLTRISYLMVALALVFIIEGAMPFISPNHWRNMLALVAQMDERVIRRIGLGSMLFGVVLLYLVN